MSTANDRLIAPTYAPDDRGDVLLFAGPMRLRLEGHDQESVLPGDLVLRLADPVSLVARFAGPLSAGTMFVHTASAEVVGLGAGADLEPPTRSVRPKRTGGVSWFDREETCSVVEGGHPERSERFVIHVSGALKSYLRPVTIAPGIQQGQVRFALPGWQLTLAEVRGATDSPRWFTHLIEAVPTDDGSPGRIDELLTSLFHLLGFVAGHEVGLGAVCGLDADGAVAWVHWSASRQRPGRPGVRWCSPMQVATALPTISGGVGRVEADPYMRQVYRRAVGYLHAASGKEVLDVRVPLACAGLELVAWATLQSEGWARSETLGIRGLPAGAAARLLLRSMDIPTEIPDDLGQLARRARSQKEWAGPEVIFNVRNALIHPPTGALSDFAVPTPDEMFQAWQLSTWYLELALLRMLGFDGDYWNRLRLGRNENDVEPVPWIQSGPAEGPVVSPILDDSS